jgi:gamma-glutamylputrescine oxidase
MEQAIQDFAHTGSYYVATANAAPHRSPLRENIDVDICIVGGGFSGLSTALHLVKKGFQVVLLEASMIGWGASGRNGGQIVNGFSRDLMTIEKRYGIEAATAIGEMSLEGGNIIRQRVEKFDIRCDLKPGNVFAAFSSKQMKSLDAVRKNWDRHGHASLEMLDRDGIQQHVNSDAYVGGMLDHQGGHLHPLNLCLGEAAAFESLGGKIYEHSAVTAIASHGDRKQITTQDGSVSAARVVVCGNAYLGNVLPQISNKIMPVSTQIVTTEVLGQKTCDELMPSQSCIEDCNYMLDYFRITADHRLLFGGGSTYGGATPDNIVNKVRPNMEKVFPALKNVEIDFAWSGNFALTMTRIPHFGMVDDNLYFLHGYSGHGVTASHLAGRLVAEAIDGSPDRLKHFSNLPYYPLPGGRMFRVPLSVIGSWWYIARDKLGI